MKVFTFEKVPKNSVIGKVIHTMELLPNEYYGHHSNIQLTALGEMFKMNPDSQWYLLVDDDTFVVKQGLDRMIADLDARGDVNETEYYLGKCAYFPMDEGDMWFAVGGGGILMNRKCLAQLAPRVDECRVKHADIFYGDTRIGACLFETLKMPLYLDKKNSSKVGPCGLEGYTMSNWGLDSPIFEEYAADSRIVTLHEKDKVNLQRILDAVSNLTQNSTSSEGVTFRSLAKYLNKTGLYWSDLSPKQRNAAATLGHDESTWDSRESTVTFKKWWNHLTDQEKIAANDLGYDEKKWDDE